MIDLGRGDWVRSKYAQLELRSRHSYTKKMRFSLKADEKELDERKHAREMLKIGLLQWTSSILRAILGNEAQTDFEN